MLMNDGKIFLNMKNKVWLRIEKYNIKYRKIKTLHSKRLVIKMYG